MPIGPGAPGAESRSGPADSESPAASEARAYFDQRMERAEVIAFGAGQAAVFSTRSPTKTTANEDAAAVIPLGEAGLVLVVADGVGGAAAGETASALAVTAMRECLASAIERQASIRTAILDGFDLANERVLALGTGAATTLSVVEIQQGVFRPYHAGDSLILAVGLRGKIKLQTAAHSPVGFAIAAGLLAEAEAMHHDERHLVSNVIGASDMRIELGPITKLARRDTVLVASDGLSDNLHTAEIVELMRKGSLSQAADRLQELSQSRMRAFTDPASTSGPSKPDDLSFVLFRPAEQSRDHAQRRRRDQTERRAKDQAERSRTSAQSTQ